MRIVSWLGTGALALALVASGSACGNGKRPDTPTGPTPAPVKGPVDVVITTGAEGGTYAQVGRGIASTLPDGRFKTKVTTSAGSFFNVAACSQIPNVLGLAQLDAYIYFQNDPETKALADKVRVVIPLYLEEVHILVRRDGGISDFTDVKGKKLNIGAPNSGTRMSAAVLLSLFKIPKGEITTNDDPPEVALQKLVAGELDVMFYTGGLPIPLLMNLPEADAKQVQLFSFSRRQVDEITKARIAPYFPDSIPARTYPWQENAVLTVSTLCTLFTHASSDDDLVGTATRSILGQSKALTSFHPKFGQVDVRLAKLLQDKGFAIHPAALKEYK